MSIYRTILAAVAAMGIATCAMADDTMPAAADTTQATTTETTTTETTTTETKVNVNTATVKQLTKVEGLNRAKATAIVSYRKKHGDFKSVTVEELRNVRALKKLSDADLQKVADQLTM